ncbi:MAG: acyltransferase, partial [Actinomycetota bacterium]
MRHWSATLSSRRDPRQARFLTWASLRWVWRNRAWSWWYLIRYWRFLVFRLR